MLHHMLPETTTACLAQHSVSSRQHNCNCKQQAVAPGSAASRVPLQALALDEEVPDTAELEDDTEPDVLGISKHKATLVRGPGGARPVPCTPHNLPSVAGNCPKLQQNPDLVGWAPTAAVASPTPALMHVLNWPQQGMDVQSLQMYCKQHEGHAHKCVWSPITQGPVRRTSVLPVHSKRKQSQTIMIVVKAR